MASRDIMFNVSGVDLNLWIMNSFRQYAGKLEMAPLDIAHRTTGSMLGNNEKLLSCLLSVGEARDGTPR